MERKGFLDFAVGVMVLMGILSLLFLAYRVSSLSNYLGSNGYWLTADFENIGNLQVRAAVRLGGVKIGQVDSIGLEPRTYKARVKLWIRGDINNLPTDTSADVYTEGLLGANYVGLIPGFEETYLKAGDHVSITHSALILENLIGQLLFDAKSTKE